MASFKHNFQWLAAMRTYKPTILCRNNLIRIDKQLPDRYAKYLCIFLQC